MKALRKQGFRSKEKKTMKRWIKVALILCCMVLWGCGTEQKEDRVEQNGENYGLVAGETTVLPENDESSVMPTATNTPMPTATNAPTPTPIVIKEYTKGLQYELSENGQYYIVTGAEYKYLKELYIPSEYNGKPVKEIKDNAFKKFMFLEIAVIPDSVEEIGFSVFSGCEMLEVVILPSSLEKISHQMFYRCEMLKKIEMPRTIKTIESLAFAGAGLTEIDLPEGLLTIKYSAFEDTMLSELIIPASVTQIEEGIYRSPISEKKSNLEKIEVSSENEYYWAKGNCLVSKEGNLILGCNGSVVPDGVKSIGRLAFYGCRLEDIKLPDSLVKIESYAFCKASLESLDLSNTSLSEIGDSAFIHSGVQKVSFPSSIQFVKFGAFDSCRSLQEVNFSKGAQVDISACAFKNCFKLEDVILPEGLTLISASAFLNCGNLKHIKIPDSVTKIEEQAFMGCSSLEELELSQKLKSIGEYAFCDCDSLEKVKIPNEVIEIFDGAFGDCYSLNEVIIPKNTSYMSDSVFGFSENVVLYVYKGSYAERYAKKYDIPYQLHE